MATVKTNFIDVNKLKVLWKQLDEEILDRDRLRRKKIPYPKGSIQAAVEQAINELKGGVK